MKNTHRQYSIMVSFDLFIIMNWIDLSKIWNTITPEFLEKSILSDNIFCLIISSGWSLIWVFTFWFLVMCLLCVAYHVLLIIFCSCIQYQVLHTKTKLLNKEVQSISKNIGEENVALKGRPSSGSVTNTFISIYSNLL